MNSANFAGTEFSEIRIDPVRYPRRPRITNEVSRSLEEDPGLSAYEMTVHQAIIKKSL